MRKIKWTSENLKKEALKYTNRRDFRLESNRAYQASCKKGLLKDICSHMPDRILWTEDKIKIEAKKYSTRDQFYKKSNGAYSKARLLNILDKVCSHMPPPKSIRWTKILLKKESLKYKNRTQFHLGSQSAYQMARIQGVLDEICTHMPKPKNRRNRSKLYTKEEVIKISKGKSRSFLTKNKGLRKAVVRFNLLHLFPFERNFITLEEIKNSALNYSSRQDFSRNEKRMYGAAWRLKILDDLFLDSHSEK